MTESVLKEITINDRSHFFMHWERKLTPKSDNVTWAKLNMVMVASSMVIYFINGFYKSRAVRLTEMENHYTDTQYENNLIAKVFLFQFINSYFYLFYVAFLKANHSQFVFGDRIYGPEQCQTNTYTGKEHDCIWELQYSLYITFATIIVMNNGMELGTAFLKHSISWFCITFCSLCSNAAAERKKEAKTKEQVLLAECDWELDFAKAQYEGPFDDYAEMVVEFGYVTLFVSACPIVPFLALVNNLIELRLDAKKLARERRRPVLSRCGRVDDGQTQARLCRTGKPE